MTRKQAPLNSGFGASTTALQASAAKNLRGMTAIVTGGYSGIGLEATRALASAGARVIVTARDAQKAQRNLHGIQGVESVHPGEILTDLVRHLDKKDLAFVGALDEHGTVRAASHYKSPAQGAATLVWCGVSPRLEGMGDLYCEDCEVATPTEDHTQRSGIHAWAIDPQQAEKRWALSEQLSGITLE